MSSFDIDPNASEYPTQLRNARLEMGLSQGAFAGKAGYSTVMQGRYETDRSKSNSAVPSERTARMIRKVIESASGALDGTAPTTAREHSGNGSLKSVSVSDIEEAVAAAIAGLIGADCKVEVETFALSGKDWSEASFSARVTTA